MRLHKAVKKQIVFRVGSSSGKIEVDLLKYTQERWQSLGSPLENHLWFGPLKVNIIIINIVCLKNQFFSPSFFKIVFPVNVSNQVSPLPKYNSEYLQDLQISYRKWKVLCSDKVTHDTIYLVLDPPPGTIFQVPIGEDTLELL